MAQTRGIIYNRKVSVNKRFVLTIKMYRSSASQTGEVIYLHGRMFTCLNVKLVNIAKTCYTLEITSFITGAYYTHLDLGQLF